MSEDDFHKGRDKVQELTDQFIARIDELGKLKEKEILEI
ncbi:MAG: ribosome recycling factor [Anaerolineae bacterium]